MQTGGDHTEKATVGVRITDGSSNILSIRSRTTAADRDMKVLQTRIQGEPTGNHDVDLHMRTGSGLSDV